MFSGGSVRTHVQVQQELEEREQRLDAARKAALREKVAR